MNLIKPYSPADAFRAVMRQTAQSVSVVTCGHGAQRVGLTVSSMTSVSMEPPALLVCINRRASLHPALAGYPVIAVNVLAEDQAAISAAFAGQPDGIARFETGGWHDSAEGPPVLAGAVGHMIARVRDRTDWGSHSIFIAEIIAAKVDPTQRPLLYRLGDYGRIAE